ncbi:transcriptional regulator [Paenibacillus yonginensis]|uniref:GTP cyclohydrolase 1 type 2 homolog n=1 Tax=Paenibacillus yonginensis TaxID=1462996 RepID=A0A1B1N2S9_9BACL|nr:Nif3-like dinuclear metal center hexameric protein [Paenibacillus yonginensis]ANS75733.1 transcriptional regulator [Paenibacillus yonginensis]
MALQIKEVLAWLTTEQAQGPEQTVDGLKAGDESAVVNGIATAFMATHSVIAQTAPLGVNLLITHEGLYYSHHDPPDMDARDSVYREKRKLIESSGLAVFRLHDYIHRYEPDCITEGLIQELGWEPYIVDRQPVAAIAEIPPMRLEEVASAVKERLGIPLVRAVGDLAMPCRRVGLLVGYRGGGGQAIPLFEQERLDLIIAGEGPEWETPEYVRDACSQGWPKGLLLLGHAPSEEPGMKLLAKRLKERFPDVPVHCIPGEPLFKWI